MIQLNKEDFQYCKTVYEELLSGAYSKDKVKKAYELMFGNSGQIINNKRKRAQFFSYWTKGWVEMKEVKPKAKKEEPLPSDGEIESEAELTVPKEEKKKPTKRRRKKNDE